jgi:hypothetical protein
VISPKAVSGQSHHRRLNVCVDSVAVSSAFNSTDTERITEIKCIGGLRKASLALVSVCNDEIEVRG